jgi:membrane protein implicated in regulation of membrane protease activity
MSETHYFWWILALIMVVLELVTGTFYLLVLALGCAGGAIMAMFGLGISAQVVTAALVSIGGWAYLRWRQLQISRKMPDSQSDNAVNLDIGESVEVTSWNANGETTVNYRGSQWLGLIGSPDKSMPRAAGTYKIVRIEGNRLVLEYLNS